MTGARRLAIAGLCAALLAACAPVPGDGFRDPDVFIGQSVRYAPDRMAGRWQVTAQFGPGAPGSFEFDAASETFRADTATYPVGAAGLVVMWVDTGFRTAAVGTVDGRAGFILDRTTPPAPDRYAAALDMLAFNGWDTSRITRVR